MDEQPSGGGIAPAPAQLTAASEPFSAVLGMATLMRQAFLGENLAPLGAVLLKRIEAHPDDANALLDCSTILLLMGDTALGLAMQARALAAQTSYLLPGPGAAAGLKLLVIMGPGALMWNTPVEFLTEGSDVQVELLFLTPEAEWSLDISDHDVLLVAVAESEENKPLLARLALFLAEWPRPVLNAPERIAALTREQVSLNLQGVTGVAIPPTVKVSRATLDNIDGGALAEQVFPIILRPVDSHAGLNLDKMASRDDVAAYLGRVAGDAFYLSRFVDYASADGLYRKYRIALIGGRPFLSHLAISSHWMIHYLNAGMRDSADKRAEEAECMAGFDDGFARRHGAALQQIAERLGLPYLQLDCAETLAGDLLIFEAGSAMVIHNMDEVSLFPYKRAAMNKLFAGFRQLLEKIRNVG
jgi:hypothetical protein